MFWIRLVTKKPVERGFQVSSNDPEKLRNFARKMIKGQPEGDYFQLFEEKEILIEEIKNDTGTRPPTQKS